VVTAVRRRRRLGLRHRSRLLTGVFLIGLRPGLKNTAARSRAVNLPADRRMGLGLGLAGFRQQCSGAAG
jgi:hypothetical protein